MSTKCTRPPPYLIHTPNIIIGSSNKSIGFHNLISSLQSGQTSELPESNVSIHILHKHTIIIMYCLKYRDKEVHLPFPQEHPYTSHISRFAVFPDTNYRPPPPVHEEDKQQFQESIKESNAPPATQDTLLPRSASVQTQTTLSSFKPLPAYYVPQKAGEWGLRVEEHHLSVPGIASLNPDVGRTFWDLPRSRQHRVRVYNDLVASHTRNHVN